MKYSVVTFGCRVNQADSLVIDGELRGRGGREVAPDQADLVIVNTCSVTATADQGARQTIRRIARTNPGVRVVVTGCYATRCPDDVRELSNVVQVIPNVDKDHLLAVLGERGLLHRSSPAGLSGPRDGDADGPCGHALVPGVAGRTALTLRVQTGCEEACSYCIIPRTRGRARSTPLADVIERIQRAIDAGYKEIVITGVHLGSYGRDLNDSTSLETLVHRLGEWDDDVLFRLSSLEPMDCSADVIATVAGSSRLAPHFHLPVQHGADSALSRMNRPYTSNFFRDLIARIHTAMPHAAIGSDVIVGFPGETDDEFAQTEDLLRDLPLSHLHVFPYSDRPGTVASGLPGKVDGSTIRERGSRIRAIGHDLAARFRRAQLGRVRRALTVDDGRSAVTDNYVKVSLERVYPRNEWVSVTIK